MKPDLLTVEDVLEFHALQLARYRGGAGVRDLGLLESAVVQPRATFAGELLHADLFEEVALEPWCRVRQRRVGKGARDRGTDGP